jgi:hypothetical protein
MKQRFSLNIDKDELERIENPRINDLVFGFHLTSFYNNLQMKIVS